MQDVLLFDFVKEGDEKIGGMSFARWRQIAGLIAIGQVDVGALPTGKSIAHAVAEIVHEHLAVQPQHVLGAASMYGGLSAAAFAFYQDTAGVAHKLEAHVMWVDEKPQSALEDGLT